jgi:hypothetical protein
MSQFYIYFSIKELNLINIYAKIFLFGFCLYISLCEANNEVYMARKKDNNGDGFTSGGEYVNEVTKVRNLHATSRRIRSQEKRDKCEHMAFVIAHKEYLKERGLISKAETNAKREQYKREREIRRSRAKRM